MAEDLTDLYPSHSPECLAERRLIRRPKRALQIMVERPPGASLTIDVNFMTDEEKKAAELAEAESQAKLEEEKKKAEAATEDSAEDDSEEGQDSDTDFDALLREEREAREKAEQLIAKNKVDAKRKKPKTDEEADEDEDEDDKPLSKREYAKLQAQDRRETNRLLTEARAQEIVKTMATSEKEAEYILEIHQNRAWPAHISLQTQLEEAFAIANRTKLVGERNEALRGLKNRAGIKKDAASETRDNPKGPLPKTAPQDEAAFTASGFKLNSTTRRWEKMLPNGDTLYRDPVTKETKIQKKSK